MLNTPALKTTALSRTWLPPSIYFNHKWEYNGKRGSVKVLLVPDLIVEGSDRESRPECVRQSQMHLVIWAA